MNVHRALPWWRLLTCLAILLSLTLTVAADDARLKMIDGSIWKGEVGSQVEVVFRYKNVHTTIIGRLNRIAELYVEVEGRIERIPSKKIIMRSDLIAMKTIGAATVDDDVDKALDIMRPDRSAPTGMTANAKAKRGVFFLPLEGTVGIEFRHQEMEAVAAEADKIGPGQIIVIRINSPGGLVIEGEDIHNTIMDIRKRHRVVAWIEEAISGGCAAAICCEEIYFMTEGTAGSVTMFAGGVAAKGEELQEWMRRLGSWMEDGGRSRYIAEAMIHAPRMVSYDKDSETGEITWHNDMSGEFILSRPGQNLTFNASNAVHSGFAQGVADTHEELAELLDLPSWHELGDGVGRKISGDWLRTAELAQSEIPKILFRISRAGIGRDGEQTIGRLISLYQELISWNRRARRIAEMAGVPDTETLKFNIQELRRQLARMRGR